MAAEVAAEAEYAAALEATAAEYVPAEEPSKPVSRSPQRGETRARLAAEVAAAAALFAEQEKAEGLRERRRKQKSFVARMEEDSRARAAHLAQLRAADERPKKVCPYKPLKICW